MVNDRFKPWLMTEVQAMADNSRRASYGVCVSQLVGFAGLRVLVTLAAVMEPLLPDFLGGAVVVLNFVRRFRGFVADAVPRWRNVASDWGHFCGWVFRSRNFAATWCADLKTLWVNLKFRSSSGGLLTVMVELAVAWVLCGGLRTWLSARSLLVAVLRSFGCSTVVRASDSVAASSWGFCRWVGA